MTPQRGGFRGLKTALQLAVVKPMASRATGLVPVGIGGPQPTGTSPVARRGYSFPDRPQLDTPSFPR